jgi:hypothetical protein
MFIAQKSRGAHQPHSKNHLLDFGLLKTRKIVSNTRPIISPMTALPHITYKVR